jgi:hypothetical protein
MTKLISCIVTSESGDQLRVADFGDERVFMDISCVDIDDRASIDLPKSSVRALAAFLNDFLERHPDNG